MSYRVQAESFNKVLNLGNLDGSGINTSLVFKPGVGLVVIKTIPEAVMQAIKDYARDQRDLHRKGTMIGNTQRHWRPTDSIPIPLYDQFERELGPRSQEPKKWAKRLNSSEYRDLRTSEGNI